MHFRRFAPALATVAAVAGVGCPMAAWANEAPVSIASAVSFSHSCNGERVTVTASAGVSVTVTKDGQKVDVFVMPTKSVLRRYAAQAGDAFVVTISGGATGKDTYQVPVRCATRNDDAPMPPTPPPAS